MGLFKRRATQLRPPVGDLATATVEAGGQTFDLSRVLVAARVEGPALSVVVYHPDFADLLDEPRVLAAYEVVLATLGEDGLRHSVHTVAPATHPPIDPFGLEPLRAFVRSLGVTIETPTA